jgi:hypothetical protein
VIRFVTDLARLADPAGARDPLVTDPARLADFGSRTPPPSRTLAA